MNSVQKKTSRNPQKNCQTPEADIALGQSGARPGRQRREMRSVLFAALLCSSPLRFSFAVLHCGSPLRFSFAILLSGSPLRSSFAVLLRSASLRFSFAVLLCGAPLRCSFAFRLCISPLRCPFAMLLCGAPLRCSFAFLFAFPFAILFAFLFAFLVAFLFAFLLAFLAVSSRAIKQPSRRTNLPAYLQAQPKLNLLAKAAESVPAGTRFCRRESVRAQKKSLCGAPLWLCLVACVRA